MSDAIFRFRKSGVSMYGRTSVFAWTDGVFEQDYRGDSLGRVAWADWKDDEAVWCWLAGMDALEFLT